MQNEGSPGPLGPSEKEGRAGSERGWVPGLRRSRRSLFHFKMPRQLPLNFRQVLQLLLAPYLSPQLQGGASHTVGSTTRKSWVHCGREHMLTPAYSDWKRGSRNDHRMTVSQLFDSELSFHLWYNRKATPSSLDNEPVPSLPEMM